jgi:predicted nucleic acid-binding protein
VKPWAIVSQVDYLLVTHAGSNPAALLRADQASGAVTVEWGRHDDLQRAHALYAQYRALDLRLVDATVAAMAKRLRADAIATVDVRD